MKRILFTILGISIGMYSFAQKIGNPASAEDLAAFWSSQTYVVATNDNIILDALISSAVKKHWNVTQHKVISTKEFMELRKNPKNSFITITTVLDGADKKAKYQYLSVLMGHEKAKSSIDAMPEIASIPFACDMQKDEIAEGAMIETCILFLQKHVKNLKEKAFNDRLLASIQQPLQAYNYDMSGLKNKTIYISKNDVDSQSEMQAVETKYPNKFKFVTDEELSSAINSKDSAIVIAYSIYPQRSQKGAYAYKMAMNLEGALFYFYFEKKAKNFLFKMKDFEMMGKQ
ncbi:MAG: hypothetical protein ACRCSB_03210 [Bacteroidales bacterium]